MEYWNEPKVSDLAPEHENLTELVAGLLLAGSSVITASALDGDCEKAGTSGVLAAATAQTLPGAVEGAPHPCPEDLRRLLMGATEADVTVVREVTDVLKLNEY